MKKSILTFALCAVATLSFAQKKFYVCQKFDSDGYDIDKTDVSFNEDYTEFYCDQSAYVTGDEAGNSKDIDIYDVADIDSIVFVKPEFTCVKVVWDGTNVTVDIPSSITGVTYTKSGAHVTILSKNTTDEILYVLEGKSTNGSLTINGQYKLTVHLNGVELTSKKGAALDIESGKRTELKMIKGTTNTFVDYAGGGQRAALFCKGHLEIKGKGTLNVTGNAKHGICADEYLEIKKSTGTINILKAKSDGIHCGEGKEDTPDKNFFEMKGGILNIAKCSGDCIDSDDYSNIYIKGGEMNLDVSQTDGCGLKCDSIITMTGGTINLNVSGSISNGIRAGWDTHFQGGTISGTISGKGAKGIKARKTTLTTETVRNGGDAHFEGTKVDFTLTGGNYTIDNSRCIGIRIDKDMYQSDGDLHVTVSNAEAIGVEVKGKNTKTGGTLTVD